MTFGEYIREKRWEAKVTLREFCERTGIEPPVWSRIEEGVEPPPSDEAVLTKIMEVLDLFGHGSEEEFELARLQPFVVKPPLTDEELAERLPAFARKADGERLTGEEMLRLIETIRNE